MSNIAYSADKYFRSPKGARITRSYDRDSVQQSYQYQNPIDVNIAPMVNDDPTKTSPWKDLVTQRGLQAGTRSTTNHMGSTMPMVGRISRGDPSLVDNYMSSIRGTGKAVNTSRLRQLIKIMGKNAVTSSLTGDISRAPRNVTRTKQEGLGVKLAASVVNTGSQAAGAMAGGM